MRNYILLLFCFSTQIIFAQNGRIDTLLSVDGQFEIMFQNQLDSNDVLSLSLLSTKKNGEYTSLSDTTLQMQHNFYKNFMLEFDGDKFYKYVYDSANGDRFYLYTEDFTMPKGGRLELAYCLYSNVSYPNQAYQLKVEGMAFVQAYIDEKGCVVRAKPLSRIGYGIEQEMMKAVVKCGCAYEAGKRDGVKVKSIWNIPMRFEL